ncbi:hypothetical protein TSAR_012298 [Trichomalopsis sarcophagae]|uniref:DUF4780 domain-containing protein n=1 Tax=Trichomalopsis sarcophagae TaxID=543379 RepID=A0A232FNS5_9HYME|nr:hypothetical protein TSAR_012298 [Trichomalopsis sarcophagae]
MVVTDQYARTWAASCIPKLDIWEGASIKVGGVELLQKVVRTVVWVPGKPEETVAILARLQRYNPALKTGAWRILNAEKKSSEEAEGTLLVLGVPESGIRTLSAMDNKAYYDIKGAEALKELLLSIMASTDIPITQINLHRSNLTRRLSAVHTAIELIQEPWCYRGTIRGLGQAGRVIKGPSNERARTCIVTNLAVLAIEVPREEHISHSKRESPTEEVSRLVEYCEERGLPLVVGCDANAHHLVWGSTNTNDRGRPY